MGLAGPIPATRRATNPRIFFPPLVEANTPCPKQWARATYQRVRAILEQALELLRCHPCPAI